eukprot:gene2829-3251_t
MSTINSSLKLLMNLSKVQAVISKRFDVLNAYGMGFNDFVILYLLQQAPAGKMRRIDLADKIGITASGITRLLLPMEKVGWVSRESNERDARVSYVVLSPAGRQLFEDAKTTADDLALEIVPQGKSKNLQMQTLQNVLSADRLASVEQALKQTFNHTDVQKIDVLRGGLSASAVYKIKVQEQFYVLKLDVPQPGLLQKLPGGMEIAAAGGLAPAVFYLNPAEGISLSAFIQSEPLHTAFKPATVLLPALAKTIRSIHELPLFSKESNVQQTVAGLLAQFRTSGMLQGAAVEECLNYCQLMLDAYPWEDEDKVSSHNDLNPNNMLFGEGRIWVIDWDAAFKNDRYVDLAVTANFYVNDAQQEELFLEAYFGAEPNAEQRARFFLMRQICRMVYAMLMFRLAGSSSPEGTAHDPEIESVRLAAVKELLGQGKINLEAYPGQFLFGKALFNEALQKIHQSGETKIAEVISDDVLINDAEQGLQLLVDLYYQGFDKVIVHEKNITPEFFDLKTRLAGEVLQKFSNYRVQLVIVGDFEKYPGKSIRDFIFESNNGKLVNFLPSVAEAVQRLFK